MTEVGVGFVRLVPSMKGFGAAAQRGLRQGLKGPAGKAGKEAGDEAGRKLGEGVEAKAKPAGEGAGRKLGDGVGSGVDAKKGLFSRSAGRVGDIFKTGLAAAGVAGGAVLAAGIASSLDTEVSSDRLVAQLGLTGGDAEKAGRIASSLWQQGFDDAAAGVRLVQGQFGDLRDMATADFQAITAEALTFSDVLEQDLPMSVNAAAQMVRTGLAKDSTEALSLLTVGIQQGADKAGDLAEGFNEYSTQFRQLGLSGADAVGLMVQGVRGGARDADIVADALKSFAVEGKSGADDVADAFEMLGMNAAASSAKIAAGGPEARAVLDQVIDRFGALPDSVDKSNASIALFGTQSEDLQAALGALDLDTAASGIGDYSGAVGGLDGAYDNAKTRIDNFRRVALVRLADFIDTKALPALNAVKAWAEENPGKFRVVAGVIGVGLVTAFAAWAVSAASAAVATLAATWPVLAIVAAVGLLAAGLIWAYNNVGWFQAGVQAVAGFLTGTLLPAITGLFGWVRANWPLLLAILTGPIGMAVLLISRNWSSIKSGATAVKDWIVGAFNSVVSFFTGIPARIGDAASGMWDGISSAFKSMVNKVLGWWNGISFTLPTIDIPSVSVPGLGTIGGGSLGGQTFSVRQIPLLARGGIAMGPMLAGIGEGGEPEAVAPLSKLEAMVRAPVEGLASARGSKAAPAGVVIDVRGGSDDLVRLLNKWIRTNAGGDVQRGLGRYGRRPVPVRS